MSNEIEELKSQIADLNANAKEIAKSQGCSVSEIKNEAKRLAARLKKLQTS